MTGEQSSSSLPSDDDSWKCKSVTFPAVRAVVTTWSCLRCTFENDTDKTHCDMCDSESTASPSKQVICEIPGTKKKLQRFLSTTLHSMPVLERQNDDELEAKWRSDDIISSCRTIKTHFVDDQFPPTDRSIGSIAQNFSTWSRIRDIACVAMKKETVWTVMLDPQPKDIEQGDLGDCWLMAALALITERSRMLSHIVLSSTVNDEGIYLARRQQLFVPLIEKACAKVYGSYHMLAGGSIEEGLELLTGAPSDRILLDVADKEDNSNRDVLWSKMMSACESNLIMGAATGRMDISDAEYTNVRLHRNHAYSVRTVYATSRRERYVMLRDPHAQSQYMDKYIPAAKRELLQKAYETEISTGSFWVSWVAFRQLFLYLTICHYHDDLFDIRLEGDFTPHSAHFVQAYYFHLDRPSTITISLFHQRSNRKHFYANHTQSFVLCDIVNHSHVGLRVAIICSRRQSYMEWTGTLPIGSYVLIPFSASYWNRPKQKNNETKFTLVIHSFNRLDVVIVEESSKLLADSLIAASIENSHTSKNVGLKDCIVYQSENMGDISVFLVENASPNRMLNIDVKMSSSVGIRSSRNANDIIDCIPPKHRQLIFLMEDINEDRGSTNRSQHPYTYTTEHVSAERRPPNPMISRADDIHAPRPISDL